MEKIEVYKRTEEDWHPSIDGKYVRVKLYINVSPRDPQRHIVCAWGNDDDYGMEILTEDKEEARRIFLEAISPDTITKEGLKALGLKPC